MDATDTPPAAPAKPKLTRSAVAYLAELERAAALVLTRREQAELAERMHWMFVPSGIHRPPHGPNDTMNPPLTHVDGYEYARLQDAVYATRTDVGRVAWWFATAALASLDAVLAGQEMTGRRLEQLTLLKPGRDQEVDAKASAWAPCFRPHLPGDGELRTGDARLDDAMDQALAPLRDAYSAVALAEDMYRQQDDPYPGEEDQAELTDSEASALTDAEGEAMKIPGLLIAYASVVMSAAVTTARLRA